MVGRNKENFLENLVLDENFRCKFYINSCHQFNDTAITKKV